LLFNKPHITTLGNTAISLDWNVGIDADFHDHLIGVREEIEASFQPMIKETVMTYQSILLILHEDALMKDVVDRLESFDYDQVKIEHSSRKEWRIPVLYDRKHGPDLTNVAHHTGLSEQEVIQLHSEATYRIYFTGFMPGFLYLGGLINSLHVPRKNRPDIRISSGSVAIGGEQTGIYPRESPGGWHVIGKTPLPLFQINTSPPSPFKAGDNLQFVPIDFDQFRTISKAVLDGQKNIIDFCHD
jgi:inhibitor of KinA